MNRITEMLGIKYPIIQGAMQDVAKARLVAAVSNAGGLGVLASGQDTGCIIFRTDNVKFLALCQPLCKE
mgnify:CR=1 FL=1